MIYDQLSWPLTAALTHTPYLEFASRAPRLRLNQSVTPQRLSSLIGLRVIRSVQD
jgi:hypothetical protein